MPNVTEAPTVHYDQDRNKVTIYRGASNASVELVQPTYKRRKTNRLQEITFSDANETIELRDPHTYTAQPRAHATRRDGESVEIINRYGLWNNFGVACTSNTGRREVKVTADVADSIIRERVQGFAARHPELAAQLGTMNLSIGKFNGYDATVAELFAAPRVPHNPAVAAGNPTKKLCK